jgi:hypothetical protein
MRISRPLVVTVTLHLLAGGCTAAGGSTYLRATAQLSDADYCQALAKTFTTLVGNTQYDRDIGGSRETLKADVAIAQCEEGNPGPAIPVLEQSLSDSHIELPPRYTDAHPRPFPH